MKWFLLSFILIRTPCWGYDLTSPVVQISITGDLDSIGDPYDVS